MKKYLLPNEGRFFKANLHCHTTMSDGEMTPAEMKEAYKAQGYSIIAYTDHELMFLQNHLQDDDFLPLNGLEFAVDQKAPLDKTGKKVHMSAIAMEPDNIYTPCFNENIFMGGNLRKNIPLMTPDPKTIGYERKYSPDGINEMISIFKDAGFFLTYNHPNWSLEYPEDYSKYTGFDAIEIYNHGTVMIGHNGYSPEAHETFLRKGEPVYCLATDDNHNHAHNPDDSFGGFVMIKAEKLEYRTIMKALKDGNFYASQGPQITELWMEDGKVHIECSDAERIILRTKYRRGKTLGGINGNPITAADFDVFPEDVYFHITVTDRYGKHAHTQAYFL